MAKDRKKIQHIHSSVFDKQPTPESLEIGELAVNNNSNCAFISTKNSSNNVVRFSEDSMMVNLMENKEVFTYYGAVLNPSESDLKNNKSQLIFKLNQVVANNTVHGSDVNGKNDMHGNPINPLSPDGSEGGAGFAVNMDIYAMNGSNPSFSSITAVEKSTLKGDTVISGSSLNINDGAVSVSATNISTTANTLGTSVQTATTNISNNTYNGTSFNGNISQLDLNCGTISANSSTNTIISSNKNVSINSLSGVSVNAVSDMDVLSDKNINLCGSINTNIGFDTDDNLTASTTTVRGDKVVIDSISDDLGISSRENIIESSEKDITITANDNLITTAGKNASLYGVSATTLGTIGSNIHIVGSPITIDGNTTVNGTLTATAGFYSSDERLKENILNINKVDFDKTKDIQIKSFNFKNDNTKRKTYGVIAQDVEKAGLSELVHVKEDGFKAVDYTSLTMLKLSYLEEYCSHLNDIIKELKEKIEALEKQ